MTFLTSPDRRRIDAELSRLSESLGDLLHRLPGVPVRQSRMDRWLERWVGPVRSEVRDHLPDALNRALGGSRGWTTSSWADLARAVVPAASHRPSRSGGQLLAGAVLLVGIGLLVGLAARR